MTDNFKMPFEAAKKHARSLYPEESCGFIVDGAYVPVVNQADDPSSHKEVDCGCRMCAFKISTEDSIKYLARAQMILHSHPDGNLFPSRVDMAGQISTGVPWGIIALDESRTGDPEVWGDQLPIQPLLGRQFMHGIRDCYSVIRDAYRLGSDGLKAQGVTDEWPFAPITLKDVPRNDAWWETDDDLYGQIPFSHGWREVSREDVYPGDCFLMKIRSDCYNHAGVLISKDLIMHHLPSRMSRREPAGLWARQSVKWLRYTGMTEDA